MAEFPALNLYTDAFMADTPHLGALETGAYLSLLMASWRTADGGLPDDDRRLARMARCTAREWSKIRSTVMAFWTMCQDGKWRQKRLEIERDVARAKSQSAARAARIKWLKENEKQHADAAAAHMRTACETDATTSTSTTIRQPPADAGGVARTARPPPKPRVVKVAIPIGWQPAPETVATLAAKGYSDHEIAWQRDRFLAHFLDSGERRPGWERSFHNWVTRDPPGKRNGGAPSHAGRYPSGGRQTDGSITGALAFLARQRAENGDDS